MVKNDEQALAWFILALFVVLCLLLPGCASVAHNPILIDCKGKGSITGTGYAGATIAVGGHEANTFTLTADCGEGFHYSAGPTK
jgi:hypothetical protein